MIYKTTFLTILFFCSALSAQNLRLPAIISDNMLLQEAREAHLWGWADNGSKIEAELILEKGQTIRAKAQANSDGRFNIYLDTKDKIGSQGNLSFSVNGTKVKEIKNVLIGDLWLASGQSNMAWKVERSSTRKKDIPEAKFAKIRFFYIPRSNAPEAKHDYQHIAPSVPSWKICSPETVGNFSAVAYHFARSLHINKKIPVGIIECAWGGSVIEAWLSKESLNSQEDLKKSYNTWQKKYTQYYKENKKERFDIVDAQIKKIRENGNEHPINLRKPGFGWDFTPQHRFTYLYNAMYKPISPASLKGVIWYQGESNCRSLEQIPRYIPAFKCLVDQYRKDNRNAKLPVFSVSLAGFEPSKKHMRTWSQFREVQTKLTEIPFTAQALAIDIGSKKNVHPGDKTLVGDRLARAARAIAYGEKINYHGPQFHKSSIKGNEITLLFVNLGDQLSIVGKPFFEIAGADENYKVAKVLRHDKNSVTITCKSIQQAKFIRYNYRGFPGGHLYNSDKLPATPFKIKI